MAKTKSTSYNPDHIMVIKMDAQPLPVFTEVRDKEWINYGQNNDYPYYLIELYNKSAKHNAIVNGKVNYLLGSGWEVVKEEGVDTSKLEAWVKKCNPYESLNEVTRKILHDYILFNGIAPEITWNKTGRSANLSHIDFANIRTNIDGDAFFYTKNWFKTTSQGTKQKNRDVEDEEDFKEYSSYDPNKKKGQQLLYVKGYRPNLDTYPLPTYIGAVQYIDVDKEIANYHYNNLKNGFTATYMLKFYNGIPTEEEQKKLEQKIKEKLAGTSNAGKFIMNFSDGKDRACEVEVIPMTEAADQFNILNEQVQQEIFTGHQISSPMLFGIKTAGQLGGRTEIIEANELFQNTYVKPHQQFVEEIFNTLIAEIGFAGKLKLGKLEPVGLDYFENNLWNILTDEEKREKAGLKKLEPLTLELSDKLAVMPPYLLNKVLEKLTDDEIRAMVGLESKSVTIPAPASSFSFKKDQLLFDHVMHYFENSGEPADNYEVIESNAIQKTEKEIIRQTEKELFAKKSDYINTLNADDRAVVDLLDKDNLMPAAEIAKALKMTEKKVQGILRRLEKNGVFVSKEKADGTIMRKPVDKAIEVIEKKGAKTEDFFVKYSYGWLPEFSNRDIGTSRDFCRELLKKNRLYSREEIEKLNNDTDLNVWQSRGGWYTKPGTDVHLPFCRHVWIQNLVRKF